MARWVSGSGKWTDCHFVLTRCGFLHWFNESPPASTDIVPADSLNLSRHVVSSSEILQGLPVARCLDLVAFC